MPYIEFLWIHSKLVECIDWLGLNAVFKKEYQSYHDGQFTYSCVFQLSHTSTHNILSKPLAAFPHRLWAHWWMTLVTVTFVKRRKECWPSWESNSQPLNWQPLSFSTELLVLGILGNRKPLKSTTSLERWYVFAYRHMCFWRNSIVGQCWPSQGDYIT